MVAPRELNESLQKISAILALLRSDLLELAEAKAPAQRLPVMAHLDWIADQFEELGAELTDGPAPSRERAKTDARHRTTSSGSPSPRHRPSHNAVRPPAARHAAKAHDAKPHGSQGAASNAGTAKGHATRHSVASHATASHRAKPHSGEAVDAQTSARDMNPAANQDATPETTSAQDMDRATITTTPPDPRPQAPAPEAPSVASALEEPKQGEDGSAQ